MLVLTRKVSEKIQIGENITICLVRIDGNRVRIGIEAPAEVAVRRAELPQPVETQSAGPARPRVAQPARRGSASRLNAALSG